MPQKRKEIVLIESIEKHVDVEQCIPSYGLCLVQYMDKLGHAQIYVLQLVLELQFYHDAFDKQSKYRWFVTALQTFLEYVGTSWEQKVGIPRVYCRIERHVHSE